MAALTIVNPSNRSWTSHRYVLSFGAVGTTHLMAYANSLEDALEECAEWLAKHAPGHIMPMYGEEHMALIHEQAEEHGLTPEALQELDDDQRYDVEQDAVADMTYTEAGYLTSYEWFITLEDPSRAEIKAFIASLSERHYSDDPVVQVA